MARQPEPSRGEIRGLPCALEEEQAVLGAMLQSKEAIDTVSELLTEDDFYRELNKKVFVAIMTLHSIEEPVDVLTLANELKRVKDFEKVGGSKALMDLVHRTPSGANVEYYCRTVKDKAKGRKLISAASKIMADAYEDSVPIKEQMDMAEFKIFEATEQRETNGFKAIGKIIGDVYETVCKLTEREHKVTGIPSGFDELDEMTEGFQKAELIVIGARPSVGKTALALNIAWNCASGKNEIGVKYPVGIFSLEMTEEQLSKRLICSVSKVNWKKARRGELLKSDTARMSRASAEIHEAPIYLNDSSSLTVFELKAEARRLKKNYDVQLLVVDYLQLIHSGASKDNREQEVAFISRHLKALAKDLNIPVVVLSQLSRPMKGQEAKRPVLSDLRESGAVEQDADVVIFIHRDQGKYELIVSKQRNGPIGEVNINFLGWCTQFESIKNVEVVGAEKTIEDQNREWID